MFISFNLLAFLVWLFVSTFIPGAILSFALFKKHGFSFIEKLLMGFALGLVLLPLIPFLLYLLAGVKFSSAIAYASVVVLYVVALAFFVKEKAYEGLAPKGGAFKFSLTNDTLVQASLALILVLTYVIRIGTYSPIYQELDPYFYTYVPEQLLTMGQNPPIDWTAWYPEVALGHRIFPLQSYLEATWYALFTGGTAFSSGMLFLVSSMLPPVLAMLSVFFVYLLISRISDRKWGIVTSGLVSFLPVFIYKLSAGEQGSEPYAFFGLAFLFAAYALALKAKDIHLPTRAKPLDFGSEAIFPVLAGLAYYAFAADSLSGIVGMTALLIFIAGQSILFFFKDEEKLKGFILKNAIFWAVGPLIGVGIVNSFFVSAKPSFLVPAAIFVALAFSCVLLAIKRFLPDRTQSAMALGIVLIAAVVIYAMTPVGAFIKSVGQSGFSFATFQIPLDRTIAEQNLASSDLSNQIGFISQTYSFPPLLDTPQAFFSLIMYFLLLPFSVISNGLLGLGVAVTNFVLGTSVSWTDKDVSMMLFWLFMFFCSLVYCLWKFFKDEDDSLFMLLLAAVVPATIVGLLKIKYTIYAAFLIAVAVGFSFVQIESFIRRIVKDESERKTYLSVLFGIGIFFLLFQFLYQGFAPSLVWGSFQTLYQNDPAALAGKFQSFCGTSNMSDVCAAAADPMGYASNGTNYQYDGNLCMLSVYSDPSYLQNPGLAPQWEVQAAFYRCQRLADYWVDSMEWINTSTEPDARITSWWDYGHWINYLGQRAAVLRNDQHASPQMVGEVAHAYIAGTPDELKSFMEAHASRYALFDVELIASNGQLGNKYGALNYLSCAQDNLTSVADAPGGSQCEADHTWETIFISQTPCVISSITNKTGLTAYEMYAGQTYIPYYPPNCETPTSANDIAYCQNFIRAVPTYCVGNVTLANGQSTYGTYYLNETYPNGDLKVNKAFLQMPFQIPTTSLMGPVTGATLFYTEDPLWIENGVVKSGYEDRKGKFYDSNLYRAMFLQDLPGFKLVYSTPNGGAVKIYEIINYTDTSNATIK